MSLRHCTVLCISILTCFRITAPASAADPVPAAAARAIDGEVGFAILVWQYRTDAVQDAVLYDSVNLSGFHIDRGRGQQSRARFALDRKWAYYIDHAAGKGILHLTDRSGLQNIPRDGSPAERPYSFAEASTLEALQAQIDENVPDAISGRALAVALDDEVSIGTFNSPLELDYSPGSIRRFQSWVRGQYPDGDSMHRAWMEVAMPQAELTPKPFEFVREQITDRSPHQWRLAPWMDFRTFNDDQFAGVLADATRHASKQADGAPVGIVGAQQPSAYGGFDYSRLRHSLQFIEAYDIGGTNEILNSFWSDTPRKPRMQTFFASGNVSQDRGFLWYYLAHGNRGVIAWPSIGGEPWFREGNVHPHVQALAETFQQVQSPSLAPLAHPNTRPLFDPIAVLVSHPSARLGWAIDASTHGKTWPRRSSSLDNTCNSTGKNRVAWTRLLEDLGFQARLIDEAELASGILEAGKTRVLVLPQALALDSQTCDAIQRFAESGGIVIADFVPAITDEHGTGYEESPLAELFGVAGKGSQADPWFDGSRRYEIDGERYNQPFAERISDDDCVIRNGQALIHRDLVAAWIENRFGNGLGLLINQSPTRLCDPATRRGATGATWRKKLFAILSAADIAPEVLTEGVESGVECLRYELAGSKDQIWCWVANPTRQAKVDGAGKLATIPDQAFALSVSPSDRLRSRIRRIIDLRSGDEIPIQYPLELSMPTDEATIIKVEMFAAPAKRGRQRR